MILSIQTGKDNPVLRKKAELVKEITPKIRELISDMIQTMDAKQGIGLAAPQVGHSLQIIIAKIDEKTIILINPKIIKRSLKKDIIEEGCLSLPNTCINIKRSVSIAVKAININNKKIKIKAENFLARIIQHEIDHLNGILISDK